MILHTKNLCQLNPLNPKGQISSQTWLVFIPKRPEKRPLTQNNRIGVKLFSVYILKAQNLNKRLFQCYYTDFEVGLRAAGDS